MASDWEWRSEERYRSIVQKLDELEGVLRAYAATKGITSVPAQGMGQIQPCHRVEDRTLFLKIHLEEYLISWEVLDQVFSSVGTIEVIEIFDNDPHYHSRICFRDRDSVLKAFDSLNGRCIYDDCCRMELFVDGRASSGRLNQVEAPIEDAGQFEGHQAPINSQIQSVKRQIARISNLGVSSVAGEEAIGIPGGYSVNCNHELSDSHETKNPFEAKIERQELTQIKIENDPKESTKENSNGSNLERSSWKKGSEMFARQMLDQKIINVHQNMGDFDGKLSLSFKQPRVASESIIDSCQVVSDSFELVISNVTYEESVESGLGIPSAHQVFEELSLRGLNICDASILQGNMLMGKSNQVFDPGDTNPRYSKCYENIFVPLLMNRIGVLALNWTCCTGISNRTIANGESILMPFDRGKSGFVLGFVVLVLDLFCFVVCADSAGAISFPFDRGKIEVGNWVVLSVLPIPVIQAIKDQKFDSFMMSVLPIPVHYAEF